MEPNHALLLENQLCFPLYAASREVIKRYRPWLEALDLTYTQYIAMMVVWERRRLSVRDLGETLYLDSGTLTPVLKSLEAKGFIRRYRCKEDERLLIVELTEVGAALQARAAEIPERVGGCIAIPPEDAAQLYQLLYRLLDALR